MSQSKKVVNATAEFVDIAGMPEGLECGGGAGQQVPRRHPRSRRNAVRAAGVRRPNVVGDTDPLDDLATLELELVLADAASAETQLERRRKAAKSDKSLAGEVAVLEKAVDLLQAAMPLYRAGLSRDELDRAAPVLPHHREAGARRSSTSATISSTRPMRSSRRWPASSVVPPTCSPCACSWKRRPHSSMPESGPSCSTGSASVKGRLPGVISAAYHLLGLRTFLTTGDKESRAWTFRAGAKAPECAGVIHSDLQRGFIRAEVIRWDELLSHRIVGQGEGRRQAARRRQGLRGAGRRHVGDPLQRVTGAAFRTSRHCSTRNSSWTRCSRSGKSRFASSIDTTSGRSTS